MNERKTKHIERMAERFFLGETSLAEERRLYRLFRRKRLPAELERLRPAFAAFASMSQERPLRTLITATLRRVAIGTAAALAVALCIAVYADIREDRTLVRLYGGSYVIENGRRIDDLSAIKGDIERTLDEAQRIEDRSVYDFIGTAEQDVLNNITDPGMLKEVEQILNE